MSKKRLDTFGKPPLFRNIERGKTLRSFSTGSARSIYNTNITSENSFKYDPYGSPLKSTQQLPIDYSKFENHTFFNSAIAKIKIAFSKAINKYPFDGSLFQIEEFEDKLTGYESYVMDSIPKYTGYLTPTGSSYIEVKNIAGNSFPEHSSKKTGDKILDPRKGSISFEAFLAIPDNEDIDDMSIFHVSGSDLKIEAKISGSLAGETHCTASFRIVSGSEDRVLHENSVEKGKFNHISFVLNKENNQNLMESYVNGRKSATSLNTSIEDIQFTNSFFIGLSGSFDDGDGGLQNYRNFSGSIKDFRIYHQARNEVTIQSDYRESVYKNEYLVANFRFNEPTGSYAVKKYVLDTSGNSLHAEIKTEDESASFFDNIRSSTRYTNPVSNENKKRAHVLFPDYPDLVSLNQALITSGSEYDNINPNLITRLVPPHYYEEVIFESGESSPTSEYLKQISGNSIPGSAEEIKTNLLNVLLFSWANIFDEVKMFIDSFGNVIFSDYKDEEIVPDQLILYAAKHLGVELPPLFTSNISEEFFDSKSVYSSTSTDSIPLKRIQSVIWKRILADAAYYRKTKGTIESLKTMFRSSGIDPDKMFAFIEKGSNTIYTSNDRYESKSIDVPMLNFSGSLARESYSSNSSFEGTINKYGLSPNKPHLVSTPMSSSIESAGFFTSGSWSVEGYYSFLGSIQSGSNQSLLRLQRNSYHESDYTSGKLGGILNIVATKDTTVSLTGSSDSVAAYFTDDENASDIRLLKLTNVNIFDGDLWYVSFSKKQESDILNKSSSIGDEYTLRCYKCGTQSQSFVTSSLHTGSAASTNSIQNEDILGTVLSGSQILIGSQSLNFSQRKGIYNIPESNIEYSNINYTDFSGKVSSIRFWSKFLTEKEATNHSRDARNYGTGNPNLDSMFLNSTYGRLRLHVDGNQPVTSSNGDKIVLNDFSQNSKTLSIASRSFIDGFESEKSVNSYEKFTHFVTPNKIDEINSQNKIRVRSIEKNPDLSLGYQNLAPVYGIINSEEINDDARFAIEMSIARIINEKINNEVSDVLFFENILGKKNNQFSSTYHELDFYSNSFFKNIEGNINIEKLLSVYTWLESSFEEIIKKSLPKKTKFLGMNYVVEPHTLERSKVTLHNENSYMVNLENNEVPEESNRISIFTGDISKF